jgi:chromosome segregation ATPase
MTVDRRLDSIDHHILGLAATQQEQYQQIIGATVHRTELTDRHLNLLIEQIGTFTEGLTELRLGFAELRVGFAELRGGFAGIKEGFAELREDFVEIKEGMAEIREDFAEIKEGFAEVKEGFVELRQTAERQQTNIDRLVGIVETLVQRQS